MKYTRKPTKRNFVIEMDRGYIVTSTKNTGTKDYFSENQTFLNVLQEYLPTFDDSIDGRVRLAVWLPEEQRLQKYLIYDLAYACYAGIVQSDSFLEDMAQFVRWKEQHGMTVDHADNNPHNNTTMNLSLMKRELNAQKSSIVARFVKPYAILTAYCSEEYRISMRTVVDPEFIKANFSMITIPEVGRITPRFFVCEATQNMLCKSAEDYVACLRQLYDTRFSWCCPNSTPRSNLKENISADYYASDIQKSLFAQEKLLQAKSTDFDLFRVSSVEL